MGATQVNPGNSVFAPEGACEQVIFSGGGFSNHFAIPSYQKKVVHTFLDGFSSHNFTKANFNSSGNVNTYVSGFSGVY